MSEVTVVNVPDSSRFEARIGDETVGRIEYVAGPTTIELVHTIVDPGHEGEGIGGALAHGALEQLQAQDPPLRVIATCPFVRSYLQRHPEFAALTRDDQN